MVFLSTGDSKVLTQGTLQNSTTSAVYPNRCGNEELYAEVGLGGNRMPSLADEVVPDSSLKAREETEDAITSKEPSEQREMETAILHSEDNLAAGKNTGLCYTQVFTILKPMLQTKYPGIYFHLQYLQAI